MPRSPVSGEIVIPGEVPVTADVHISVEEVSVADAPARTVAEKTLPGATLTPRGFEFLIDDVAWEESGDYAVRVHVDVDRDGAVSPGDFISTQAHRVLGRDQPSHVLIPLTRV